MKLANMVDLGSAGSNTLQVQVLPIVIIIPVQKKGLSLKPSGGRKKKPSWMLVPGREAARARNKIVHRTIFSSPRAGNAGPGPDPGGPRAGPQLGASPRGQSPRGHG